MLCNRMADYLKSLKLFKKENLILNYGKLKMKRKKGDGEKDWIRELIRCIQIRTILVQSMRKLVEDCEEQDKIIICQYIERFEAKKRDDRYHH